MSQVLTQRLYPEPVYGGTMQATLLESVAELLGVVVYALLASVLAVAGALAERASLQEFAAGHATLALWEAAAGLLMFYVGVMVLREFVLPAVRERVA